MENKYDGNRQMAIDNVLSTEETCKILGRSRQQINNLIQKGDLKVLKSLNNATLFWRPDVYKTKSILERIAPHEVNEIYGPYTDWALRQFESLNISPEETDEIYVFFDLNDAIRKGFFCMTGNEIPDTLIALDAPTFVIIMRDGKEHWFQGLNCGYCGTGPNGTVEILEKLGVGRRTKLEEQVFGYKICHYYRDENLWEFESELSEREECDKLLESIGKEKKIFIKQSFYWYNKHLVLTHNTVMSEYMSNNEMLDMRIKLITQAFYFEPNPVSVLFLTEEEAIETGHYTTAYSQTQLYQIIIRDYNGRELWISCPLEQMPKKGQKTIKEVMEFLGVDVIKAEKNDRVKRWLGLKPRNIYGKYRI